MPSSIMSNLLNFLKVLPGALLVESRDFSAFSWTRLGAVLFMFPVFTTTLVVNWFFLLLDEVIFPNYRKVKIERAVFIIGLPRSGTTFILDTLLKDSERFTCFKLWELIFAPSILQKYIFLALGRLDQKCGGFFTAHLIPVFDRLAFGRMKDIHPMNLLKAEEDEVLFLYNFTSIYFNYFFPNHPALQKYVHFDEMIPQKKRKDIFRYYRRCVQRHQYVFNSSNQKFFLSKNPTFIPKMSSLVDEFPNAKVIYPLRSPMNLIPSTLSLNASAYSAFIKLKVKTPLVEATRETLFRWYEHADHVMKEKLRENGLTIYYQELTQNPAETFKRIYHFLKLENFTVEPAFLRNKTTHIYDAWVGVDSVMIASRLAPILSEEVMAKI